MKYQPPHEYGAIPGAPGIYNADPDASYVNGDPATAQEGSCPPAESIEHPMREIVAVVTHAGIVPDHNDLTQLRQAVSKMIDTEVEVSNKGAGVGLYLGQEETHHKFRSLKQGDNVLLSIDEDGAIVVASSGGAGGGGTTLSGLGVEIDLTDHANLAYQTLSNDPDVANQDLFARRRDADGVHVTMTWADILARIAASVTPAPPKMLHVKQVRVAGATVASLTADDWTDRILNTQVRQEITGATFAPATGVIVLPAGTYQVQMVAQAYNAGNHKCRLQNVTDNVTLLEGVTSDSYPALCNSSTGFGRIVLDATKSLKLQHFATHGGPAKQGDQSNPAPETHVEAMLMIVKEA